MAKSAQDRRAEAGHLISAGLVDQAEALLRDLLKRHRSDHEAMAMLAQVLMRRLALDEAAPLLRRALSANRKRADYLALAGELAIQQGRTHEALGRFDESLRAHPGYDAAIAGRADALLRLGRYEDAVEAAEAGPDTPVLAGIRARALRRAGDHAGAAQVLEGHLPCEDAPLETRRLLWYEAGHARLAMQDHAGAAEAYRQANGISDVDDPEASQRVLDTLLETFTSEAWPGLPRSGNDDQRPVLIVGLPRCGSTLVEQIIASHSQGAGGGELETLPQLAGSLGGTLPFPACLGEINEVQLASVAKAYVRELARVDPKASRVVDKQLGNILFLGLAGLLVPGARVIHCTRHPMDLGLSCWTQKFPPGTNGWANSFEGIAGTWHRSQELLKRWEAIGPLPMLEVRYEELVADLDGQVRRILEFVGLEFEPQCLRFWETERTVLTLSHDQVRRPLYASAVGRHKAWGELLAPLADALGDAVATYEAH
ncbi:MAG: sulfotransferase [Phycisphaerales bacterium]|nr:sulfotransferase [Phycisphaerales bacterium]